jgi:hypothetical protein
MRTTRNEQASIFAPCHPSTTINILATPHTSNQSAFQKISKHFACYLLANFLERCLLAQISQRPTRLTGEVSRHQEHPALSL